MYIERIEGVQKHVLKHVLGVGGRFLVGRARVLETPLGFGKAANLWRGLSSLV
jgi:hypothetical protein